MKTAHGIKVDEITYDEPCNGLPKWVKEKAATRGYGDSLTPLSLYVTDSDIETAFDCAAQGDGASCVMAQAGKRIGAEAVYFYRTTAWLDFGTGPILRFKLPKAIYDNVIDPFDKGDRASVTPGFYPLTPPVASQSLKRRREYDKTDRKRGSGDGKRRLAHTDRIVMASQTKSE